MQKLNLRQSGFTYSACGTFTKHRERIQKFRETGSLRHLYRNELEKVCSAHNAASSENKDLAKRPISEKILKDRSYEIARNPGYDGYQSALGSMMYKFLNKKTGSWVRMTSKARLSVNEQLAEELHKLVTKKFRRRKVYGRFKDNIW